MCPDFSDFIDDSQTVCDSGKTHPYALTHTHTHEYIHTNSHTHTPSHTHTHSHIRMNTHSHTHTQRMKKLCMHQMYAYVRMVEHVYQMNLEISLKLDADA